MKMFLIKTHLHLELSSKINYHLLHTEPIHTVKSLETVEYFWPDNVPYTMQHV